VSWTGEFWFTKERADRVSKEMSFYYGKYHTSIKGEPYDPAVSEKCWSITNRFDPKVREEDANTN
jgi:hypothetical protein